MKTRFYVCRHCGNLIGMINDAGVPMMCCGEKMENLVPNSSGASEEKHMPIVCVDGNNVHVSVGSAAHPMTEEHSIQWVYLKTERGGQRKALKPDSAAEAKFVLDDDNPVAVYAYCNLHGLWMTEIK